MLNNSKNKPNICLFRVETQKHPGKAVKPSGVSLHDLSISLSLPAFPKADGRICMLPGIP